MSSRPAPDRAAAPPALGWARRVLCQQLDALSRLAVAAWRLVDPAQPAAPPLPPAPSLRAGIVGLEKALRLYERVVWTRRLIDALRAKLTAELEALDNGQVPASLAEAPGVDAPEAEAKPEAKPEAERPEPRERLRDRERFDFQRRGSDKALAEILKRPTAEIIALICRELGLPEDWPRLAEEAWAREEADEEWAAPRRRPAIGTGPHPSRTIAAPS